MPKTPDPKRFFNMKAIGFLWMTSHTGSYAIRATLNTNDHREYAVEGVVVEDVVTIDR